MLFISAGNEASVKLSPGLKAQITYVVPLLLVKSDTIPTNGSVLCSFAAPTHQREQER